MVVLTFSGPAVADAQPLALAAAIVGRQAGPRAVVVSPLAGIPERLDQMVRFGSEGRARAARALAARILERHRDLARRVAPGSAMRVTARIDASQPELEELVERAAAGATSDDLWQRIQAVGGNLSSWVVAAALRENGVCAAAVESDAIDGAHEEVARVLQGGAVPVVGGAGATMVSAALISAKIDARQLHVWTEDDGVPAVDRSVVPTAPAVARLSFGEALDLARWGVTSLHPRGIELAASRGMPIVIRGTRCPERPGTVINGKPAAATAAPAALAWRRRAIAVQFSSRESRAPVFMRRILDLCGGSGEPSFAAAIAGPSVVVAFEDCVCADRVTAAARGFAQVAPLEDVALLSAVGESLAAEPRVAAGVLEALQDVTVHAAVHHPSGRSLTMLIDDADAGEAMRRVYGRFFARAGAS